MDFPSVRISEPCRENWAAMTPASGGRHCAACAKTVVDFTRMTDAELLAHLARAGQTDVCGRLRADQVGRPLAAGSAPRASRGRAWLGALLAALSLVLPTTTRAAWARQPAALATFVPGAVPSASQPVVEARVLAGSYRAEGVVLDAQTHQPIPGAIVMLQGTSSGVSTDEHGKFVLPISSAQAKITLLISFVGYETVKKELDLRAAAEPFIVQLHTDKHFLGGLGFVSPPPTLWQRVTRFFA
jgi:hypothetical protein